MVVKTMTGVLTLIFHCLMKGNPAISLGLRDFIGTGWYSSEYVLRTGKLELTAGLGFGRLAGRKFSIRSAFFIQVRWKRKCFWQRGTLGTINWFQGNASAFYGLRYSLGDKITLLTVHTRPHVEEIHI